MDRHRFTARDAVICVAVAALLLVLFQGPSIRDGAEEMKPGWERTLVLAAAKPAGWLGDQLPLAGAAERVKRWAQGDDNAATGTVAPTKAITTARPAASGIGESRAMRMRSPSSGRGGSS